MKKQPQPHLFSRLRHIVQALEREHELLTAYERRKAGHFLHEAREALREADQLLTALDEHRRAKQCRMKK